jgi:hypothetical protein
MDYLAGIFRQKLPGFVLIEIEPFLRSLAKITGASAPLARHGLISPPQFSMACFHLFSLAECGLTDDNQNASP